MKIPQAKLHTTLQRISKNGRQLITSLQGTTSHFELIFCILHILHHPKTTQGIENVNYQQSSLQWQHQGRDHSWTYLFSGYRNRGNCMAICLCHLSLTPDSWFPCWSHRTWSLLLQCVPCPIKISSDYAISTWPAACSGPACVQQTLL